MTQSQIVKSTSELATVQAKAAFGNLSDRAELAKAGSLIALGFDPHLHLTLYQGRITLTVDGWYWMLRQKHATARLWSEPVPADLKDAYGVAEHEIGVLAHVVVDGGEIASGFGRASTVKGQEVVRGSSVEAQHPYRLAEKRAEAMAIRKALGVGFDVPLPEDITATVIHTSVVEANAPDVIDAPAEAPAPQSAQSESTPFQSARGAITRAKTPEALDRLARTFNNAVSTGQFSAEEHATLTIQLDERRMALELDAQPAVAG